MHSRRTGMSVRRRGPSPACDDHKSRKNNNSIDISEIACYDAKIVEAEVQPAATPQGRGARREDAVQKTGLRHRWNWGFRVGIGQSAKTAKRKGS
jgi:hypothetical protein